MTRDAETGASAAAAVLPAPAPVRVLVAEDDPSNRKLLQVYLEHWGYLPVLAANGDQAWEVLQREDAPALAILDWMMPGPDGVELCRRLRARVPARFTYVILLTARESREDLVAGLAAGANDYITKPFDALELRARVETGVRLWRMQQTLEEQARALEAERQQTRAFRALMTERERFDAAVHAMGDGILVTDGQWRLTHANHAACRLLNLPEDAWDGRDLVEVLQPFQSTVPLESLRHRTDRVTTLELSRPTRPPLVLDGRLTRVLDGADSLASVVLTVRSITEERLDQRARADFLMLVSHKLLTPLTVLSGFFQLWKRWDRSRVLARWPEMVETGTERLRELEDTVRKLLEFKNLTTRQLEAAASPTDLATAVASTCQRFREARAKEALDLEVSVSPEAAVVAVDPSHVGYILSKLLDNAVKFADKPCPRVEVRAQVKDAWVEVSVADNGPGLPHEFRDKVFDGFVQVEEIATGQVPGLGVGLFLARRVVEANGGSIKMESRLGEGCTVSFTLPARTDERAPLVDSGLRSPSRRPSLPPWSRAEGTPRR